VKKKENKRKKFCRFAAFRSLPLSRVGNRSGKNIPTEEAPKDRKKETPEAEIGKENMVSSNRSIVILNPSTSSRSTVAKKRHTTPCSNIQSV